MCIIGYLHSVHAFDTNFIKTVQAFLGGFLLLKCVSLRLTIYENFHCDLDVVLIFICFSLNFKIQIANEQTI